METVKRPRRSKPEEAAKMTEPKRRGRPRKVAEGAGAATDDHGNGFSRRAGH
jgi:hypothetical protein